MYVHILERSYYYLWIVVFISSANIVNEFHQDYNKKLYAYNVIIFCIRTHIIAYILMY